jgi:chromosome segregation ATPase
MVVAFGAFQRQTQPRHAERADAIGLAGGGADLLRARNTLASSSTWERASWVAADHSGRGLVMMVELDHLEERIRAAVKLIGQLQEDNRRLDSANKELSERVRTLQASAGKQGEELKPRLKALEEERTTLLDERRVVARRVEEMLQKLELLEKAVHA